MKKLGILAALLLASAAQAQTVQQSGSVTAGHAVQWVSPGVVKDAGTAANGSLTSLGITNNGGPGICVQSAAPTASARNQLCLSVTTDGGSQLSSYSYGTATNAGFTFVVNGVTQGFPTVNLPVTAGNSVCFLNSSGTLTDCGVTPLPSTLPSGQIFVGNASNVATARAMSGDCTINNTGVISCFGSTAAKTFTGLVMINLNAASLPTPLTGTVLQAGNADTATTRFSIYSFGSPGTPALSFARALGTGALPSAVQSGNELGAITWNAYGTSAYATSGRAIILASATENWTNSLQGTQLEFYTTPTGGTSTAKVAQIGSGGTLTLTPTTLTYNQALTSTQAGPTSSIAGPQNYNLLTVTHQGSVTGSGRDSYGLFNTNGTAFRVNLNLQGTLTSTSSAGIFAVKDVTSNTSPTEKIGLNGTMYSTTQDSGNLYGVVAYTALDLTGQKGDVLGGEADVGIASTSSATNVIGWRVTNNNTPSGTTNGQGTNLHTAFAVSSVATASGAFKSILALQPSHGGLPIAAAGSFFLADGAVTMANFLKADNWTITGDIVLTPHVKLTGPGTLRLNADATAATAPVPSFFHASGTGAAYISLDGAGSSAESGIFMRTARNTIISPTATQSGDLISAIVSEGYGATGYGTTSGTAIFAFATQNWTGTGGSGNQGAKLAFYATPNNSFTKVNYFTIEQDGGLTGTSSSANALAAGRQGSTNPVLQVDASTASVATGLKIKGAAAGGGLALSVITSGTNEALTIDAAGSGTITLGGTSTGAITLTRATTLSAALTYGGVTLSNAVTGTGNMVLSASPTFTGTITAAAANFSGTITFGTGTLTALTELTTTVPTSDMLLIYDSTAVANKKIKPANLSIGFSAHKNGTDQTGITSATFTKVTFGTEAFDKGSSFTGSTWTPPAGLVEMMSCIYATSLTVGSEAIITVYKNAVRFKDALVVAASTGAGGPCLAIIDQSNGTDTYEIYVSLTTVGTATINGLASLTYFMGKML